MWKFPNSTLSLCSRPNEKTNLLLGIHLKHIIGFFFFDTAKFQMKDWRHVDDFWLAALQNIAYHAWPAFMAKHLQIIY